MRKQPTIFHCGCQMSPIRLPTHQNVLQFLSVILLFYTRSPSSDRASTGRSTCGDVRPRRWRAIPLVLVLLAIGVAATKRLTPGQPLRPGYRLGRSLGDFYRSHRQPARPWTRRAAESAVQSGVIGDWVNLPIPTKNQNGPSRNLDGPFLVSQRGFEPLTSSSAGKRSIR